MGRNFTQDELYSINEGFEPINEGFEPINESFDEEMDLEDEVDEELAFLEDYESEELEGLLTEDSFADSMSVFLEAVGSQGPVNAKTLGMLFRGKGMKDPANKKLTEDIKKATTALSVARKELYAKLKENRNKLLSSGGIKIKKGAAVQLKQDKYNSWAEYLETKAGLVSDLLTAKAAKYRGLSKILGYSENILEGYNKKTGDKFDSSIYRYKTTQAPSMPKVKDLFTKHGATSEFFEAVASAFDVAKKEYVDYYSGLAAAIRAVKHIAKENPPKDLNKDLTAKEVNNVQITQDAPSSIKKTRVQKPKKDLLQGNVTDDSKPSKKSGKDDILENNGWY